MAKTIQPPMLTGLSLEDRQLMLTMMAALGSAAQLMVKHSATWRHLQTIQTDEDAKDAMIEHETELDAEANSIIDICKRAKDRLKPGSAVLVN